MFCAGADLDAGAGLEYKQDTARTHRDGGGTVTLAIHNCRKPVIAAINGSAVGVGITMTLPMSTFSSPPSILLLYFFTPGTSPKFLLSREVETKIG